MFQAGLCHHGKARPRVEDWRRLVGRENSRNLLNKQLLTDIENSHQPNTLAEVLTVDTQIFQKCKNRLKILGSRKVT